MNDTQDATGSLKSIENRNNKLKNISRTIYKDKNGVWINLENKEMKFYRDIINIFSNIESDYIHTFLAEDLQSITTGVINTTLNKMDIAYIQFLSSTTNVKSLRDLNTAVNVYVAVKKIYAKDSLGIFSKLERASYKSNMPTILTESDSLVIEKARLIIKYLNTDTPFFQNKILTSKLPLVLANSLAKLFMIHQQLRTENKRLAFRKLMREENTPYILYAISSKFTEVNLMKLLKDEEGAVDTNMAEFAYNYILYKLTEEVPDLTGIKIQVPELEYLEKEQRQKVREYKLKEYKHSIISKSTSFSEPQKQALETEEDVDTKIIIPLDVDYKEKQKLLNTERFLILKSGETRIPNGMLENCRIADIKKVSGELLNQDWSAIVINIKSIGHSDTERVKSLAKDRKIILTNKTNKRALIEDIFSKF